MKIQTNQLSHTGARKFLNLELGGRSHPAHHSLNFSPKHGQSQILECQPSLDVALNFAIIVTFASSKVSGDVRWCS